MNVSLCIIMRSLSFHLPQKVKNGSHSCSYFKGTEGNMKWGIMIECSINFAIFTKPEDHTSSR